MSINMRRILAAVDFSDTANNAFDYALSLARVFNAEVLAVHILEDPILYAPTTDQSFRDAFERTNRSRMEQLVARHGVEGVTVRSILKSGPPFLELIQIADSEKCDLIVMGTHGHGPIANMLIGSVADKVVRKAHCPVLVVRPDQHQFVRP